MTELPIGTGDEPRDDERRVGLGGRFTAAKLLSEPLAPKPGSVTCKSTLYFGKNARTHLMREQSRTLSFFPHSVLSFRSRDNECKLTVVENLKIRTFPLH